MVKQGVITLYSRDGDFIASRRYDCPQERGRYMKEWEKKYAKKYHSCFIQILPDVNDEEVSEDGTNMRIGEMRRKGMRFFQYKKEYQPRV